MKVHPVIGVLSGCGGAGASTFAAVLAGYAALRRGTAFLLDCDPAGGGIDVLLGCEQQPGPRWGQVRLRGGSLDPAALAGSLPRWHSVSFLAADSARPLDPAAVGRVIDAAVATGPVVLDLPRADPTLRQPAIARCDRVVLVAAAEVRAVTAAAMLAPSCPLESTSVLVRGASRSLPAWQVGQLLGLPVLGTLPFDPAGLHPAGLALPRVRRGTRKLAEQLLDSFGIAPESTASPEPNHRPRAGRPRAGWAGAGRAGTAA